MRSFTLVSALLVAGAMSSPVHQKLHNKRAIVYEVVTNVVIEYVTENAPAPTSVQAPNDFVNNRHSSSTPAPAPVPTTTTTAVAVAPVSTSVAPVTTSVVTTSVAAAQSSSSTGAGNGPLPATLDSDGTLYQGIVLAHHNVHRANHSAHALTWNATLAQYAKEQAMTCIYSEDL